MKVETIEGGSLRVWLSYAEAEKWGLLSAERTEDAVKARKAVRRALHIAGRRVPSALLAELIPIEDGCLLLLTPQEQREAESGLSVFSLQSAEALCDLTERWFALAEEPQGETMLYLYEWDDTYALAVHPVNALSTERGRLLQEYGHPIGYGQGAVAAAAEHGRLLADTTALKRLVTAPVPEPPDHEGFLH